MINTMIYAVPDMSCAHCKAKIEKEVEALAGVQSVNVEIATKTLTVIADERVTNEAIVVAVSKAGYTAEKQ